MLYAGILNWCLTPLPAGKVMQQLGHLPTHLPLSQVQCLPAFYAAVIADEAHLLKNSRSAQYQAAAMLPSKLRYGLSGTVMQVGWWGSALCSARRTTCLLCF